MAKGKFAYWLTEDGLTLLRAWARYGLSNDQIARNIGVSRSTLQEWIKRYPDISDALKGNARDLADIEVENALRKRAMGFTFTETTRERVLNKETGEFELVVTRVVERVALPDTVAAIFWLKNRRPEDWRDRREVQETILDAHDDGFVAALTDHSKEAFADGVDEPKNADD